MRLLVLSDSHKKGHLLKNVLQSEENIDAIFHLGDGAADLLPFADSDQRPIFLLRGNCDSIFAPLSPLVEITLENIHIFAAHGDQYRVKFDLDSLGLQAKLRHADLVLFGHTHNPIYRYDDGVHFFNPGSLAEGSYGCVDLTDNGIACIHKNIKSF